MIRRNITREREATNGLANGMLKERAETTAIRYMSTVLLRRSRSELRSMLASPRHHVPSRWRLLSHKGISLPLKTLSILSAKLFPFSGQMCEIPWILT